MQLHIFIAGRHRFEADVAPGNVNHVLRCVDAAMPRLTYGGRVDVTLDSDRHPNVTYILNRRTEWTPR